MLQHLLLLVADIHHAPHLDGSSLSLLWVIPFVGILLSIALFPLLAPHFWHHHYGKVSLFWGALFTGAFFVVQGWSMTTFADTLLAISMGAVFMGANTYIGNAPNFMVKAIAEENKIPMPSFFGYMAWSFGFLVPVFILLTFVFF